VKWCIFFGIFRAVTSYGPNAPLPVHLQQGRTVILWNVTSQFCFIGLLHCWTAAWYIKQFQSWRFKWNISLHSQHSCSCCRWV